MESYESIVNNSINSKLVSSYSKLTGIKRVNTTPKNIDAPLISDNTNNFVSFASENEWRVFDLGIINVFYTEYYSTADQFFIGVINKDFINGEEMDEVTFSNISKSGLFSTENQRVLVNKNSFPRNFSYDLKNKIFISHVMLGNDLILSFGSSENHAMTIRVKDSTPDLCICVKNGTIKLNSIILPTTFAWNPNSSIEIDATEVGVLFSSVPFSLNERISYLLSTNSFTSSFSIGIGDKVYPGATFVDETPLKVIDFGIENKSKVFSSRQDKITYFEDISEYENENEILFDYFPSYNLVRIGSRNVYKTFLLDESLLTFSCMIYIKAGHHANFSVITNEYDWSISPYNILNDGIIETFSSNLVSGIKADLSNVKTFSFPSKYIGDISVRNKHQYFIEFENNNNETFIGIEDNFRSSFQTSQSFNASNLARVNLLSGDVEVQGTIIGTLSFSPQIKTLFISIVRLFNGTTLFSFGLKRDEISRNIIIVNMVHPRLYITSQSSNLGTFKLNPINISPAVQFTPKSIITQQSDISNIQNIYDEESETGDFRLSDNIEDQWQVFSFSLEEEIIAANVSLLGFKVFIGIAPEGSISSGLLQIQDSVFSSFVNKSGILVFPDEQVSYTIINNDKTKDASHVISGDFYCKFTKFNDSICMSIGKNNYDLQNLKLLNGEFRVIFAVSKATFSFFKRKASSLIKTLWENDTEIRIDASDYDIQFSSPQINGNTSYYLEIESNSGGTFADLAVVNNSLFNLPINIGLMGENWYILNKNMKNCFLKKNLEEINTGGTNSMIIENSLFMRYGDGHDTVNSQFVFLGSSPYQYVSNYISSSTILPTQIKFLVNVKKSIVKFKVKEHLNWNLSVKNTLVSLTPFISQSIQFESFNQKLAYRAFNDFEKSLVIGPFSSSETKVICFEYEVFNTNTFVGIIPAIGGSEISSLFINSNINMNLVSGEVNINSALSNRAVSNTLHKVLVIKVYPSTNGVIISIGSSFLNANQDVEVLNTSLQNFSIYFSAREITVNPFLILKRFNESGISNTALQPTAILPSSFLPLNYDPMQIRRIVGDDTLIRVTSNNYEWNVASWEYVINTADKIISYENYGKIEVTPYLNREPEWFIGFTYQNFQSNQIMEVSDEIFDKVVKSGIMFDGIKRNLISNNDIINKALKDMDDSEFIYSKFFYDFQKYNIQDPALLAREILLNIAGIAIVATSTYLLSSAASYAIGNVLGGETEGDTVDILEWKKFDKRKKFFNFYPYIGKDKYNASCLGSFSREAYISSGINKLDKDHKINFIIAVRNGSISYKKYDALSNIENVFIGNKNIDIINPSNSIVLRGDVNNNNILHGIYVESDISEPKFVNFGFTWYNFEDKLESEFDINNAFSETDLSSFYEISDVFLGLKVEYSNFKRNEYHPDTTFNRYTYDRGLFDIDTPIRFFNLELRNDRKFLRVASYRSLGLSDEKNNTFLVQIGEKYNNFISFITRFWPRRKTKYIFFGFIFEYNPWPDTYKLNPFIWLYETSTSKKISIKNMNSISELFKSEYKYIYDGNQITKPEEIDSQFVLKKVIHPYKGVTISYGVALLNKNSNSILLKKSHNGSEVSFISASSRSCSFNFELYGDQDVFFGMISDETQTYNSFEYRDSFISPYSMIAFINLRTGHVSCGPYNYISNKAINTIRVNIDKIVNNSRLIIRHFGFFSDGFKGFDIPIQQSIFKTFRFIITCGNVTNDNIMVFNGCEFDYLNRDGVVDEIISTDLEAIRQIWR